VDGLLRLILSETPIEKIEILRMLRLVRFKLAGMDVSMQRILGSLTEADP